jgi:hypothetical protein
MCRGFLVECFETIARQLNGLQRRMQITLTHRDAGVTCQSHDCKRVRPRFAQPRKATVAKESAQPELDFLSLAAQRRGQ